MKWRNINMVKPSKIVNHLLPLFGGFYLCFSMFRDLRGKLHQWNPGF